MAAIISKEGNRGEKLKVDNEEQWHMGTHMSLATHKGNTVPVPDSAPPDLVNPATNSENWYL